MIRPMVSQRSPKKRRIPFSRFARLGGLVLVFQSSRFMRPVDGRQRNGNANFQARKDK
jgi:hypothetical protein